MSIRIDVEYYDEAERQKLLRYRTSARLEAMVGSPMEMSQAEFLTYYLFHRIKIGQPGYRDYNSVAGKVNIWLGAIGECVDYAGGSLRTPQGVKQQLNEVSEHVGEAVGLAVMNRIHGLTEADWALIPEMRGRRAVPTFDFQIASDGENFIQVEAKGSSANDNRVRSDAVKVQKRKIDEKKAKLAVAASEGRDPYPATLRYGAITVIDARLDGNARCLLTDPLPDDFSESPRSFRILNRMRFLRNWIGFISPRSAFAAALATRIADMESLQDPFALDGVPLRRGSGKPYEIHEYGPRSQQHSTFMASKSRVSDGPAGGVTIQLSHRELLFLGIREDLLELAAKQRFEEITNYRAEVATISKTVECRFSTGKYRNLRVPSSVDKAATKTSGYVEFKLRGNLNYSPEGLVFGVLPLPAE